MPRWFGWAVTIAFFITMSAGVLYKKPAVGTIGFALFAVSLILAGAGDFASRLAARRDTPADQPTTLDLTRKQD